MLKLNNKERSISDQINSLKALAGSHSPSLQNICNIIPEIDLKVDACFLSNPYATDLFISFLEKELIKTSKLREVLEFYPSQNAVIAGYISEVIKIDKKNIFVGNGAIEIIQAIMQKFVKNNVIINIPTFSSYYEFVNDDTKVIYYELEKSNDYEICIEKYLEFIEIHKPENIVLINPNNPNGGYIPYKDLRNLISHLSHLENIIIDESFIHFAYEDNDLGMVSSTELFKEFPNVIVIKSMSKDFGIAGIRAGYAVLDRCKVSALLKNGYLWNSSGLSEYFFNLYKRPDFLNEYEIVRKKYILETNDFFSELKKIPQIRVYSSKANFALIELLDGSASKDFVSKLLITYGIYARVGDDKIGLDGQFLRIASRTKDENILIINALKSIFEYE